MHEIDPGKVIERAVGGGVHEAGGHDRGAFPLFGITWIPGAILMHIVRAFGMKMIRFRLEKPAVDRGQELATGQYIQRGKVATGTPTWASLLKGSDREDVSGEMGGVRSCLT
jgi:hypothetical protein